MLTSRYSIKCLRIALVLLVGSWTAGGSSIRAQQKDSDQRSWQDRISAKRHFDFGDVAVGKRAKHTFELVNTTKDPLRIRSVTASCGCTIPTMTTNVIAPGEKANLVVKLNTERFRGEKNATIHVRFVQPESKEIRYSINVNIRNLLIEPGELVFEGLIETPLARKRVMVTRSGSPYWKITEISASDKSLAPAIINKLVKGQKVTYEIECEFSAEGYDGPEIQELVATTNDSSEPKITIPIRVSREKLIDVSVESIDFGSPNTNEAPRRLIVRTAKASTLTHTITSDEFRAQEIDPGFKRIHILEIQAVPTGSSGQQAKLTVKAEDGSTATVKLSSRSKQQR